MKRIFLAIVLLAPLSVSADHMDVIEFKMLEGCSFEKYLEIVNDFNDWGEEYGYNAKVAVPLQNDNLISYYWLGTSKNAATFGKAWDAWRDALSDPESTPAQLWARFQECTVNLGRHGYDVY
ncbi:MAG: hypothetical protein ACR2RD_13715 [Woeseiaceae bacterium]